MKRKPGNFHLGKLAVIAAVAAGILLVVLATLALAQIEIPPNASVAYIQTSGPNTALGFGDWYTNNNPGAGNRPHSFQIIVPCTVDPAVVFTVELFDPESLIVGDPIDEIRPRDAPVPDDTLFELFAPDSSLIHSQTYPPLAGTDNAWNTFITFTVNDWGCGTFVMQASTSDDDDNAWRLRITPDDPDGTAGTGDEISVASFESSFQHASPGCQRFYFFVPPTDTIRLNNFDMDMPGRDPAATITYYLPDGSSLSGTPSGGTVWNNGGGIPHPPPGGDLIADPQHGWWQADVCTIDDNQYIFEPEGLSYFFQMPDTPEMTLEKDDGETLVLPGQVLTYTLTYTNIGVGAALNATIADTIPTWTTFVACSGGSSCEENPAGSGQVTFQLGIVAAGSGGQVFLTVQVDPGVPRAITLTNTAQLTYEDTIGNPYPPAEATDVDITPDAWTDLSLIKTAEPASVAAGDTLTYTLLITNHGPDDAENVTVDDTLPAAVTLVSATPSQGTCIGTACSLGTLPAGDEAAITIVVQVNAGATGSLTNTATVSTDTTETDTSNNTDQTITPVQAPPATNTPTVTPTHTPTQTPTTPPGATPTVTPTATPTVTGTPPTVTPTATPTATPPVILPPAPPQQTPNEVPEPLTILLMGGGLAALTGYARGRRK